MTDLTEVFEQIKERLLPVDLPGLRTALEILRKFDEESACYLIEEAIEDLKDKWGPHH